MGSHFNPAEIFAMAELGCQHVTIQPQNLERLLETPDTLPPLTHKKPRHPYAEFTIPERLKTLAALDPLAGPDWDGVLATIDTNFVANGGEGLDRFIREEKDIVVNKRFSDAVKFFLDAEEQAVAVIQDMIAARGRKG